MAAAWANGCMDPIDYEHTEDHKSRADTFYIARLAPTRSKGVPRSGGATHSYDAHAIWILGRFLDYTPREKGWWAYTYLGYTPVAQGRGYIRW